MTTRAVGDGELRKRVFESVEPLAFHQYDPEQLEKGIDALLALFADYAEQVAREARTEQHEHTSSMFVYENAALTYKRLDKETERLAALHPTNMNQDEKGVRYE